MTVAELRALLTCLPDNMPVTWEPPNPAENLLPADIAVVMAIPDARTEFFETPQGDIKVLKVIPKGP